jgi:hypothetical protein
MSATVSEVVDGNALVDRTGEEVLALGPVDIDAVHPCAMTFL